MYNIENTDTCILNAGDMINGLGKIIETCYVKCGKKANKLYSGLESVGRLELEEVIRYFKNSQNAHQFQKEIGTDLCSYPK